MEKLILVTSSHFFFKSDLKCCSERAVKITCNPNKAREKIATRCVWFLFSLVEKLARHFKPITRRSNHDRVITFDSHLKTVLVRVCELVTVLRDTFVDHDQLCCCLVSSACSVACLVQTVGSYWISSLSHSLCLWIVFIWLARSRESYFDGNNSSKVGRPYV